MSELAFFSPGPIVENWALSGKLDAESEILDE